MSIVQNKKAFHDYFIEEKYETGMILEGWEVKAIRAGRVQIKEAYVIVRNGELFLIGCHISALPTASTHIDPDPVRTRKLLLIAIHQDRFDGLKRIDSHPRRTSASKKAKNHLFPMNTIRAAFANSGKLIQPPPNLRPPLGMRFLDVFNGYRLLDSFHLTLVSSWNLK